PTALPTLTCTTSSHPPPPPPPHPLSLHDALPIYVRAAYGPGTQARQLLIARRLIERGVRFVQVWHGAGQPWDNHDDLEVNHRRLDRKSTRLNSSHRTISYAVFCLKKKKTHTILSP